MTNKESNYGDSDSASQNDEQKQALRVAEAPGEDGVKAAVVSVYEQEAVWVEPGGGASIAGGWMIGGGVAGLDADALAGDPSADLGEVLARMQGARRQVQGKAIDFAVEGDEDGGGEGLAAEALRAVLDASRESLAAERGGDRIELGGEGGVVDVDADAGDAVADKRRAGGRRGLGRGFDQDAAELAGGSIPAVG